MSSRSRRRTGRTYYYYQRSEGQKTVRKLPKAPPTSRADLKRLIVERGSFEEPLDLQVGKYIVSRQSTRTTNNEKALRLLDDGFADYNKVIARQKNPEAIPFEKRHYIAWCNALTRTHFKMGPVETPIPIAAISGLTRRLSKWKGFWRATMYKLCCNPCVVGHYEKSTNDYTTRTSRTKFDKFLLTEANKDVLPVTKHEAANRARRSKFFNRFAPSYFNKVELPKFMRKRGQY